MKDSMKTTFVRSRVHFWDEEKSLTSLTFKVDPPPPPPHVFFCPKHFSLTPNLLTSLESRMSSVSVDLAAEEPAGFWTAAPNNVWRDNVGSPVVV